MSSASIRPLPGPSPAPPGPRPSPPLAPLAPLRFRLVAEEVEGRAQRHREGAAGRRQILHEVHVRQHAGHLAEREAKQKTDGGFVVLYVCVAAFSCFYVLTSNGLCFVRLFGYF